MNHTMVFVNIDYVEFDTSTYNGVTACLVSGDPFHTINTGDHDADLKAMIGYLTAEGYANIVQLSSVGHFYMDLPEFQEEEMEIRKETINDE